MTAPAKKRRKSTGKRATGKRFASAAKTRSGEAGAWTSYVELATDAWPGIQERLGGLFFGVRGAVGDAYSAFSRVVTEQTESIEDRLAERKHRKKGKH